MRRSLTLIMCAALLFGCGKPKPGADMMGAEDMTSTDDLAGNPVDLATPDLATPDLATPDLSPPRDLSDPPADMTVVDMVGRPMDMAGTMAGDIGQPCTQSGDCKGGPSPTCWTATVNNQAGAPPTPGGYCSSTCNTDAQCGGNGACVSIGAAGRFCVAKCRNATTCRTGYACAFYGTAGVCYPSTIFDCDPTANMGTCTEAATMKAGGCIRGAYENKGTCNATCTLAAGSCPQRNGRTRHCVYFSDPMNMAAPDPFKGLVCFDNVQNPVAAGGDCNALDECVDGYQCDTQDGKCRQLCTKNGAPACGMGMCADAFMTPMTGPGLCR